MTRTAPPPVALVTGFEPFAGDAINPSAEIARALDGRRIAGFAVVGQVLPCAFGAAAVALNSALRTLRPQIVLATGLAGGRAAITPERVAINVADARLPDNAGAQPVDVPIVPTGPVAYWSRLPVKAIVGALVAHDLPAAVSQTAGTYVCNHIFYTLMHRLRRRPDVRAGFVHVPYTLEQAAPRQQPGLPLAVMIDAIALAIEVTARTERDAVLAGGATH